MQTCQEDEMRFNILTGNSSVVWPSSLLPGLESKCCEGKGALPSVVTQLNAQDASLPSSPSFFFLTLITFASTVPQSLHHNLLHLLPFSNFSFCSSSFFLHLPNYLCPVLPSPPSSHSCNTVPLRSISIHDVSLKVQLTCISFITFALPFTWV